MVDVMDVRAVVARTTLPMLKQGNAPHVQAAGVRPVHGPWFDKPNGDRTAIAGTKRKIAALSFGKIWIS